MKLIYNIGNTLYWWLIHVVSAFNQKAKLFVEGRKEWQQKLKSDFQENQAPVAWFHCASLGEFEQGRPVIEAFRERFQEYKVLLTFFSPSGYEIRKDYSYADWIYYLPMDGHKNANYFVEQTQPTIAFFVKYEFWHHYIHQLHSRDIPILSFSTIFRKDQIFFKSWGTFNRNILKKIYHFFVQTDTSQQLLDQIGISQHSLTGDTRFDRVFQICLQKKRLPKIEHFKHNELCLVIGSSWKQDLDVIGQVLDTFTFALKVIIAPHEIDEKTLQTTEGYFKSKQTVRYSQLDNLKSSNAEVLIIDNIGMLSSIYSYADFAYIGGAFGKGLHNTLEAATFGVPIFFGNKKYQKFQEAVDMVAQESAFAVSNANEFRLALEKVHLNKSLRKQLSDKNASYVKENLGATKEIIDFCSKILQKDKKNAR